MISQKQKIFVKGKDKTSQIRSWRQNGDKINIIFQDGKTYSYNKSNIKILDSALANPTAYNCFKYLSTIAKAVSLEDANGNNILESRYEKIDFISQDSMLSAFLIGKLNLNSGAHDIDAVYPFGFNISQKQAVDNALSNSLSIIEGPPGTGKTQTILNIISNAVMRGKSIAVVSSNNSATANVLEKLKKYNVDFIAAYLGNSDNKKEFIESQKPLPNFSTWELSEKRLINSKKLSQALFVQLGEMLAKKNKLSCLKQELDGLMIEYKHFKEYYDEKDVPSRLPFKKNIDSAATLELWLFCERYTKHRKMPGFFKFIWNKFKYGITDKSFYSIPSELMITICQNQYYTARIRELTSAISSLEKTLSKFNFDYKMKEYSDLSAKLFRSNLATKYGKSERARFELNDLWKNSEKFIASYPIILSTTYSLRSSLSHEVMYDYVLIDESSQVDLATGALALSCAKKVVVVGDLKQLPNVVDSGNAKISDDIFASFNLPEVYRYKNHSLLSAITELFPDAPRTLLREHYRCHPKIIEFCNQKFYNNELIILTEPKSSRQPLIVYQSVEGNHARGHINQRQIDIIKHEVIPQQQLDLEHGSIGIVTPYRKQTNTLQEAFSGTCVKADTVDKFQGRENDVIVLSTVDNKVSEFSDNANRLNVAISRAIEQLIVVVSAADTESDTNIGDLVRYIRYNNMDIIQSEIYSVFDYLYKSYTARRIAFLAKQKRISEYDSENLTFALIDNVLSEERFSKYSVAVHIPIKMILRDKSKMNDEEARYAMNGLTHVDFLIFDKIGKIPRLIIEVDGVSYHKDGTRQAERDNLKDKILQKYNLPYIRFKTNESRERQRLIDALLSSPKHNI